MNLSSASSVPPLPSYHMHTRWSDGLASASEMVAGAERARLSEVGISDHLVVSHLADEFDLSYALRPGTLAHCVAAIEEARSAASIPVRLGIEIDYFPDTPELLEEYLEGFVFDYVIGSVHFLDDFPIDATPEPWEPLSQSQVNDIYRRYYRRYAEMARTRLFDFLGHLDLPKKFRFLPDCNLSSEIEAALDAVKESGAALEFNTAGWDKPCSDPYPAPQLLGLVREREIPVLISDDAHHPTEVGRYFSRAVDILREAGYTETCRFESRQRKAAGL